MLPNPEVGVPYILAYDKFNQAIKELEELKNEVLNSETRSKNENTKERLEKQNQFQIEESEDRYDDLSRFESWLFWLYICMYFCIHVENVMKFKYICTDRFEEFAVAIE